MSTTTPYATHQPRRKPSVEVYFVLYLTAIILLLGTTPSKRQSEDDLEEAIIQLIDTDFEVDVQKIALIIPYVPAGSSADPALANNKDTLNLIRAHGTFEDVRFRIVSIVDTLDDDQKANDVATLVNESDTSVRFQWKATTPTKPAVFLVAVEGEASPIIPEGVRSDELRERIEQVVSERGLMKDTAYFSVTVHPVNSREDVIALRSAPLNRPNPGDDSSSMRSAMMSAINVLPNFLPNANAQGGLRAMAPQGTTYTPPGVPWNQTIMFLGAEDNERINVSSNVGNVEIVSRSPGLIEIRGEGLTEGSKEINLTLTTSSGKRAQTSFLLQAQKLSTPALPWKKMYIGKSYPVDLTPSEVDPEKMRIDVVEDGHITESGRPARFNYKPSKGISSVRFIRKINGVKVDEVPVAVESLPKADVRKIDESDDEVIVETIVYGADNIPVLNVMEGNGRKQEIPDSRVINPDFQTVKQRWRIKRIDPDKPFKFVLHAWDERGIPYTTIWNYPR